MTDNPKRRLRDRTSTGATLIAEGCVISGLISGDGDFLVNGEIDGNCDVSGTVTLTEPGRWSGTIKADNVVISGSVDGDIIAESRVEIGASARITGTVTAAEIAVAEGAVVEGSMSTKAEAEPQTFTEKRQD
ncbi:MAG: polymer-forming cytoskeletal protein [Woeseiaceae bacterium]|nr:polymer-forming cytoskeletal protein [Woeseiaceae bacterium]